MERNILAYIGVALILGISIYSNYISKLSNNIYYVAFIFGAILIVIGNMGRK